MFQRLSARRTPQPLQDYSMLRGGQVCIPWSTAVTHVLFTLLNLEGAFSKCTTHSGTAICMNTLPTASDLVGNYKLKILHLNSHYLSANASARARISDIEIRKCTLRGIEPGYFQNIAGQSSLRVLQFREVSGGAVLDGEVFRGLGSTLTKLLINGDDSDPLHLDLAALSSLYSLTELKVFGTTVSPLPSDFKDLLPQLNSISVDRTNLTSMPWSAIVRWVKEDPRRTLELGDNSWRCDSRILALQTLSEEAKYRLEGMKCATPIELKDRQVLHLRQEEVPATSIPSPPKKATPTIGETLSRGEETARPSDSKTVVESGTLREILIAIVVVGILVIIFGLILIAYKVHLSNSNKLSRSQILGERRHESAKYCSVIETPMTKEELMVPDRRLNNYGYSAGYRKVLPSDEYPVVPLNSNFAHLSMLRQLNYPLQS